MEFIRERIRLEARSSTEGYISNVETKWGRKKARTALGAFQSCTISSIKKIFNFSRSVCRIIDVLSCPGVLSFRVPYFLAGS